MTGTDVVGPTDRTHSSWERWSRLGVMDSRAQASNGPKGAAHTTAGCSERDGRAGRESRRRGASNERVRAVGDQQLRRDRGAATAGGTRQLNVAVGSRRADSTVAQWTPALP